MPPHQRETPSPLYEQVRLQILNRIETGELRPGDALPSEFSLASELGVSQGTTRKALDALARDQLIIRRQGLGTFVATQTPAELMFRFFKVYTAEGKRVQPTSGEIRVTTTRASKTEAQALALPPHASVVRMTRTRYHGDQPIIREVATVSAAIFPGLGSSGTLPNTIYDIYQHDYGVTIVRADEQIAPVAAKPREAHHLGIPEGTPLLRVQRVAFDLNDRPIEWRLSFCHLKGLHYRSELR